MRGLDQIPRETFVYEPTPLHFLRRLSGERGGPQIWCKRDDLTRLALGGNKLRKLEFLLRDALDQGADTVVTVGAAQSNHARLTAAAAASLGLKPVLVLAGPVIGQRQGNLLVDELIGAEVRFRSWSTSEQASAVLEEVARELRESGRRPYAIPMGGTNALGVLGYVLGVREIAQQLQSLDLRLRAIVCASSSGGTQAGLVLGKALFRLPFDIIGISVGPPARELAATVARLTAEAAALLEADPVPVAEITVLDGYAGPGYGQVDAQTVEAIRTMARLEGILLDPVYTGKAMAGLLDLVRRGTWREGEAVAFLHTGGIPALFAYWETLGVGVPAGPTAPPAGR